MHYVGLDTVIVTRAAESITGDAPNTHAGAAYSYRYTTNSPNGCYGLATYGSFPPGLSFNAATCTLSGTATTVGSYTFTVFTADWLHWVNQDTVVVAPTVHTSTGR